MNELTKKLDLQLSKINFKVGKVGKQHLSPITREKILQTCKDAGLVFLEGRGSYGFEAEFEDIEL